MKVDQAMDESKGSVSVQRARGSSRCLSDMDHL